MPVFVVKIELVGVVDYAGDARTMPLLKMKDRRGAEGLEIYTARSGWFSCLGYLGSR